MYITLEYLIHCWMVSDQFHNLPDDSSYHWITEEYLINIKFYKYYIYILYKYILYKYISYKYVLYKYVLFIIFIYQYITTYITLLQVG